jgi:LruC domain-containing protein
MMTRLKLPLSLAVGLVGALAGGQAWAQGQTNVDSDGDGVNDAADAAPCDSRVSLKVYAPADRTYGMLVFEDKWPAKGDFDFNDAVVAYNETLLYDSSAQLTGLRLELSVMAVGARYKNGLALRLPGTPQASVSSVHFTIANVVNSAAGDVRLDPAESEATIILSDDLHGLFGVEATREWVNTDPSLPTRPFVDMVVDITLNPGLNLSAADAPFDLYIFDRSRGAEVHRPRYRGTANINPGLFNTQDDGTSPTRAFVTTQGIPFALELPELANYPKEGQAVDLLYPNVVLFGASAGTQAQDFYRTPSNGAAFGLTPPRPLQAAAAADTSCFAPNPGVCGGATGVGSVDAPASNLCGFGVASAVSSSGGLWRWSCAGDYSNPTACTTPDWVCQPNLGYTCAVTGGSGSQTCNGSGTGYGTCTVTSCNSGYYQSGNSCLAQVCSPGSNASCSVANGTGQMTCDNLGSGYGGCTVVSCNSGYTRNGNTCVLNSGSGTPGVPWPNAPQLYCNGTCSWDPSHHCGQGDADIFCRLKTGSVSSYALSYSTATALDAPGFSCAYIGTNLGSYPQYGGPRHNQGGYNVMVQATSILANHGPGTVISAVTCAP